MSASVTHEELQVELDRLFRCQPAEMVKERNALADKLRKLGQKEEAARIKALARPSAAAWVLNQLHFARPAVIEQARAEAERVRSLHADVRQDRGRLREAMAAQRAAVGAIVAAAERCFAEANAPYGLAQQRKLLSTIQGFLAGLGDEAPGRMTHDLEPGGFEGVQVVAASAVPAPAPAHIVTAAPQSPAPSREEMQRTRALAEARQQLATAEHELRAAQQEMTRRETEHTSANADAEQVAERLREAERALLELRQQHQTSASRLSLCQTKVDDAATRHEQADSALQLARERIRTLEGTSA